MNEIREIRERADRVYQKIGVVTGKDECGRIVPSEGREQISVVVHVKADVKVR
ncbi:hypothetical protein ACMHYB_52640 [Sorangium sp. So ce1128]